MGTAKPGDEIVSGMSHASSPPGAAHRDWVKVNPANPGEVPAAGTFFRNKSTAARVSDPCRTDEADNMTNRSHGKVLIGAFIIVLVVAAAGYFLTSVPATAPTNPPDRAGTEESLPAAPATPKDQATTGSVDPSRP
jgi:hypothetical protein